MNQDFTAILKKLIAEQGKEALLNSAKCKAFLADYTKGEYKKESRPLLQALEAGVQKAIVTTEELEICKKQQIRILQEEYFLAAAIAADVVDTLALVLRGETLKPKPNSAPVVQAYKAHSPTPVVPPQKAKHKKRIVLIAGIILLVVILIVWQASLFNTFEVVKAPNGDGVMINKYHGSKQEVRIPSHILIFPVTSIGNWAFAWTGLTSVTIPNNVTSIGNGAFQDCVSLTGVTFAVGSNILASNFGDSAFPQGSSSGDNLKTAYNAEKEGTYTRSAGGTTWTKS
jgi:hypothetical protein